MHNEVLEQSDALTAANLMAPSFSPHFNFRFLKEAFFRNTNLIPRDLYQSSEAPAAGSKGKIDSNAWVKWCLNYNRDC